MKKSLLWFVFATLISLPIFAQKWYTGPVSGNTRVPVPKLLDNNNNITTKDIAVDLNGNVYVVGEFSGSLGTLNSTNGLDGFIAKFSNTGTLLYAVQLSSLSGDDQISGVACESNGTCYITGYFDGNQAQLSSSNGSGSNVTRVTLSSSPGITHAFFAKISLAGSPVWTREIFTYNSNMSVVSNHSAGLDVAVDYSTGTPLVIFGGSTCTNSIFSNGGVQVLPPANITVPSGITVSDPCGSYPNVYTNKRAFVCAYNSSGSPLWARVAFPTTCGSGESEITGVSVYRTSQNTNANAVYFCGNASGSNRFFHTGTSSVLSNSNMNYAFLGCINPNNTSLKWIDDITGYQVQASAVTFTVSNNSYLTTPYVTGNAHSSANLSYNNGITSSATGFNQDIYVARYDFNSGLCQWARSAGGPYDDYSKGIVASKTSLNSVYLTGSYRSQFTFGTTQLTSPGGNPLFDDHLFLARTDENGTLDWADKITGDCDGDYSAGANVCIEPSGSDKVWVTGNNLTNQYLNTNHPGAEINLTSSNYSDKSFYACHYNAYCSVNRVTNFSVLRSTPTDANITLNYNSSVFPPGLPFNVTIYYRIAPPANVSPLCYNPTPWSTSSFTGSMPSNSITISGLMPGVTYEWGYRMDVPACTPEGNTMAISGLILDIPVYAKTKAIAEVRVYPNPFNDQLKITLPSNSEPSNYTLRITDIAGRIILQEKMLREVNEWNTMSWVPGVYLYQVFSSEGIVSSGKLSK